MQDPLVSTEWLASQMVAPGGAPDLVAPGGAPDLVVFDCSTYLPNESGNKHDAFRAAHIPGARLFDIDVIADPDATLPHMVPSAARFEKLLGALGVSNASRVVFYDQHGLRAAARGWWLMRLFGHETAMVLDGGLPKWQREGRPIETGDARPPVAATFVADLQAEKMRGIGDVKRIVRQGGGTLILDARSRGRFDGSVPEPRADLPGGHMPGAANVPVSDLLHPDFTMKDPATLRELFAAAGVTAEQPVVTSCGSGVTACALALGLLRAGFPEPAVYDGSWTEWGLRPETPKVTA